MTDSASNLSEESMTIISDVNNLVKSYEKADFRPYKCSKCGISYMNQASLTEHERWCIHKLAYACTNPACKALFKRKHHRDNHVGKRICTRPGSVPRKKSKWAIDAIPSESVRTQNDISEPNSESAPQQQTSGTGSTMAASVSPFINYADRPCQCDECGRRYRDRGSLYSHQRWCKHKIAFPCTNPKCEKIFKKKHHRDNHLKSQICTRPGSVPRKKRKWAIDANQTESVNNDSDILEANSESCQQQNKQTETAQQQQTEGTEDSTIATEDSTMATEDSTMDASIITNTNYSDRPYECDECGKRYLDRGSLYSHQRWCKHKIAFPCTNPKCEKIFKLKHHRDHHLKTAICTKPGSVPRKISEWILDQPNDAVTTENTNSVSPFCVQRQKRQTAPNADEQLEECWNEGPIEPAPKQAPDIIVDNEQILAPSQVLMDAGDISTALVLPLAHQRLEQNLSTTKQKESQQEGPNGTPETVSFESDRAQTVGPNADEAIEHGLDRSSAAQALSQTSPREALASPSSDTTFLLPVPSADLCHEVSQASEPLASVLLEDGRVSKEGCQKLNSQVEEYTNVTDDEPTLENDTDVLIEHDTFMEPSAPQFVPVKLHKCKTCPGSYFERASCLQTHTQQIHPAESDVLQILTSIETAVFADKFPGEKRQFENLSGLSEEQILYFCLGGRVFSNLNWLNDYKLKH